MKKQRSVAIVHQLIVWHAAALVLLAGCQKPSQSGQTIRFTAVSQPAALTKTAYTGELYGSPQKERIDWKAGDLIRIYSDRAVCSNDNTYPWADYAITGTTINNSGATSTADISVSSSKGGLTWVDDAAHAFYAIYPSPGGSASDMKGNSSTAPFSGNIPKTQEGTAISVKDLSDQSATINVYYPPMSNAYMVAYNSFSKSSVGKTSLEFEPAYTAFHISAGHNGTDPAITIKSVELISESSALTGDFEMYYDSGSSNWTYPTVARNPGNNDRIMFSFGGDITLDSTNPKVEFVLFALPQDLTGLTLRFNVEIGGETKYRSLALKTAAGVSLTFNARHKALIKGLLIPGSTWTINGSTEIKMQESVADWEDDTTITPVEYGTSGIIFNATGLNQYGTENEKFDFSIFAPAGGTWKVTAVNAADGSPATSVVLTQEGDLTTSTGGVLSGTIGTENPGASSATWICFTASGPTGSYALKFSVEVSGTEYSIDSEVARGGWGPGKSYSYFSF